MKRKEYIKPEMQVILLKSNTPLLAGSLRIYDNESDYLNEENYADVGDIL